MPIPIEAYTVEGTLSGVIPFEGHVREALELEAGLLITQCRRRPLDAAAFGPPIDERIPADDLLLVLADPADLPVHAAWHDVRLAVGPYEVEGLLPTMPGFDPGRALARPSGSYVLIRDAVIRLLRSPAAGEARHAALCINRYAVDEVVADLDLGFFFPGARIAARHHPGRFEAGFAQAT